MGFGQGKRLPGTEEPCQTRRLVCSSCPHYEQAHSPAPCSPLFGKASPHGYFCTEIRAGLLSPAAHSWRSCTCILLPLGMDLYHSPAGAALALGSLSTWTRCRQLQAVLPWAGPHARMTMRLQAGTVCGSIPNNSFWLPPLLYFQTRYLPLPLVNHPMECGAGQQPCFGWCVSITHRCVQELAQHSGSSERMSFA